MSSQSPASFKFLSFSFSLSLFFFFENSKKLDYGYRTLEGTQEPSRVLAMNGLSHEPGVGFMALNSGDFAFSAA